MFLLLIIITISLCPIKAAHSQEIRFLYEVHGPRPDRSFQRPISFSYDPYQHEVGVYDATLKQTCYFNLLGVPLRQGPPEAESTVDREGRRFWIQDKGTKLIMEDQLHHYKEIPLPATYKGQTSKYIKVQAGTRGQILLIDQGATRVLVLDRDFSPILSIGSFGPHRNQFLKLNNIFQNNLGDIYVIDGEGIPIQVFNFSGQLIGAYGLHGVGPDEFLEPTAAVVDRLGRIWITDAMANNIRILSRTGQVIATLGEPGLRPGQFLEPVDLFFDHFDRLFVLEKQGRRFQVFSTDLGGF